MTELEKEFEKQSGIGKTKVGLVVCVVLVVILAVSSVWLYTRIDSLQNEIDTLERYSDNLLNQVNTHATARALLEEQVESLEESQLHMLNSEFVDLFPEPYVNCYGIVFNSGTKTAYNVIITWYVYNIRDTLLATREISLGHIEGKSSQTVDIDIQCMHPDWATYEMIWDYTI